MGEESRRQTQNSSHRDVCGTRQKEMQHCAGLREVERKVSKIKGADLTKRQSLARPKHPRAWTPPPQPLTRPAGCVSGSNLSPACMARDYPSVLQLTQRHAEDAPAQFTDHLVLLPFNPHSLYLAPARVKGFLVILEAYRAILTHPPTGTCLHREHRVLNTCKVIVSSEQRCIHYGTEHHCFQRHDKVRCDTQYNLVCDVHLLKI